jgi:hypothetical protein
MKKLILTDDQAIKVKEVLEAYPEGYSFPELRMIDKFLSVIEKSSDDGVYMVDDSWIELVKRIWGNTKFVGSSEARAMIFAIDEALSQCQ